MSIKTYQAIGEYGPTAHHQIEVQVRAYTYENAVKQAIRQMKKSGYWEYMGEHNVNVYPISLESVRLYEQQSK